MTVMEEVRAGRVPDEVAGHAADLAKGVPGARAWDDAIHEPLHESHPTGQDVPAGAVFFPAPLSYHCRSSGMGNAA